MIRLRWLTQLAILLAALGLAVLAWALWVMERGLIWGTAFWFIFFTAGIWVTRLFHKKEWPQ